MNLSVNNSWSIWASAWLNLYHIFSVNIIISIYILETIKQKRQHFKRLNGLKDRYTHNKVRHNGRHNRQEFNHNNHRNRKTIRNIKCTKS